MVNGEQLNLMALGQAWLKNYKNKEQIWVSFEFLRFHESEVKDNQASILVLKL